MTQEDIIKYKEIEYELNTLINNYYDEYLKQPYEDYIDWKWSSENPNEIIIIYGFQNYNFERDYDEYPVQFKELVNFKPNNYD
jgi:hypothetical protein